MLIDFANRNGIGLYKALQQASSVSALGTAAKAKIAIFVNMIEKFRKDLDGGIAAMAQKTRKSVVEECDAGMVKIVVPVFVNGGFLGSVSGCGLLLADNGKLESFLVNKTTGIDEEEIERRSQTIGYIAMEDAEALGLFIAEEINKIVESFEKT